MSGASAPALPLEIKPLTVGAWPDFERLFGQANRPQAPAVRSFPYQRHLANDPELPWLLHAPTGTSAARMPAGPAG